MPNLVLKPVFDIELTAAELRLICLALDGRIDFKAENGADTKEAKKLGAALFKLRASQTMEYAKTLQPKAGDQVGSEGASA